MVAMDPARLRRFVVGAGGWRRRGLAAGSGLLAALALPPFHAVPLLVPAFTVLAWLIDQQGRPGAAFRIGWWFGFGFFSSGLYWVSISLLVEPEKFAWLIPFTVFGAGAGLGLFVGAGALVVRMIAAEGVGRVLVLAASWTLLEWVRGWILTGFPWNLMATVWTLSDAMIQSAAAVGVYGLGALTVAVAAMPSVLRWRPVLAAFGVLALVWCGGLARLASADDARVPGVRLRLVQPNIPQAQKWLLELRRRHVLKQIALSRDAPAGGGEPPTHVIWGETMVPYFLAREKALLEAIAEAAPENGLVITGALRTNPEGEPATDVWNSIHAVDPTGRVAGTYDKFHLVPFGEYLPWRPVLGLLGLERLAQGRGDFGAGHGPLTLRFPGLPPVSPLICYEVIFPGRVSDSADRPEWLLNLTNDGWFGHSPGPYQHFASARFRAVEEGLPLVRVANTGISAVVDPYGRIVARMGLGDEGVLDSPLPAPLNAKTLYSSYSDWIIMPALLLILVWQVGSAAAARRNGRRVKEG